jgi:hypothetical protein
MVFEGINILVCRVEPWIHHGVPRVEKGCGTLLYAKTDWSADR